MEKGSGIFAKPQICMIFKSGSSLNIPTKLEAARMPSIVNAMQYYVMAALESESSSVLRGDAVVKPENNISKDFVFCTQCGKKLPAGNKFCSNCGNKL